MRPPSSALIGFALLAFGCSQPPKAVFVDSESILKQELPADITPPNLRALTSVTIPSHTATLPRSAGVLILDKAEGKIEAARKLIEADRDAAIRTLARRLATIRSEEIDVQKIKALEELQERQVAYLNSIYDKLFAIFQDYADRRGPKFVRSEFLKVKKPDIFVSRNPTNFAQKQREEMDRLKVTIQQLDAEYNKKANQLLNDAQIQLSADQGSLQAKFETLRASAIEQAERNARAVIEKSSKATDLNLGQNRSVVISEVEGESVQVAGSSKPTNPTPGLDMSPVVDLAQRRASLGQQLAIWLKTRGYVQAKNRSGGPDATQEFIAWRKSHRLGR